jgi:hypothetical protein
MSLLVAALITRSARVFMRLIINVFEWFVVQLGTIILQLVIRL